MARLVGSAIARYTSTRPASGKCSLAGQCPLYASACLPVKCSTVVARAIAFSSVPRHSGLRRSPERVQWTNERPPRCLPLVDSRFRGNPTPSPPLTGVGIYMDGQDRQDGCRGYCPPPGRLPAGAGQRTYPQPPSLQGRGWIPASAGMTGRRERGQGTHKGCPYGLAHTYPSQPLPLGAGRGEGRLPLSSAPRWRGGRGVRTILLIPASCKS